MAEKIGATLTDLPASPMDLPEASRADAIEVAALCETAAQYLMRLKESARGTWAAMAMEDLVDAAVDIKAAAKALTGEKEDVSHG